MKRNAHPMDTRAGLVALAVVGLHTAAAAYPEHLWGFHHIAFLPTWAVGLLAVGMGLGLWKTFQGAVARQARALADRLEPLPAWSLYILCAALGMVLFAAGRIRHQIFGDGFVRLAQVTGELSPVRGGYEWDTYLRRAFHGLISRWGWEAAESYALLSIVFGGLFVVGSLGLARLLGRDRGEKALLFCGLAGGGGILLFCGYIETYSSAVACGVVYLWAVVAYVQGRVSVVAPATALAATGAMHVLGLLAAPSLVWAFLLRRGWVHRLPLRRRPWAAPVAVVGGVVAGALLFRAVRPYSMVPLIRDPALTHLPYTLLSPAHLLDLLNFTALSGLPGWLGLALGALAGRGERRNAELEVLGVGAAMVLGMTALINPALGSLDWDLMALHAAPWNAFGTYYLVRSAAPFGHLARLGPPLAILSLAHTVAWVSLQWSPQRAMASIEAMAAHDPHTVGYRGGVLGVKMLMEGHGEPGVRLLEGQAGRGGGGDPIVARSLAQVYLKDARYDDAERQLQIVLSQVSDREALRALRYFRANAPDGRSRSRALLEGAMSRLAHPTYFGVLAEFYMEEGLEDKLRDLTILLDDTIARAEADLERFGPSGQRLLDLGALYLRRGRLAEAEEALRRAGTHGLSVEHRAAAEELLGIARFAREQEGQGSGEQAGAAGDTVAPDETPPSGAP